MKKRVLVISLVVLLSLLIIVSAQGSEEVTGLERAKEISKYAILYMVLSLFVGLAVTCSIRLPTRIYISLFFIIGILTLLIYALILAVSSFITIPINYIFAIISVAFLFFLIFIEGSLIYIFNGNHINFPKSLFFMLIINLIASFVFGVFLLSLYYLK